MKSKQTNTLWGAAFTQTPSAAVIAFTAGRDVVPVLPADVALLPYDVSVNMAHVVMLAKTGIIPALCASKILKELVLLEQHIHAGTFVLDPDKEDVHTNIESWLQSRLGVDIAGNIHTARSRNDQVVTDMKLYTRDAVLLYVNNCIRLTQSLLKLAEQTKGLLMPGFTHHQHAMVTTFGHITAGFASMILRDIKRFETWYALHNTNALGNAVSYGTSYPVDKKMTAKLLGFDGPDHNSLDAVTNRWEPEADIVYAISVFMNHLSLIAETLILLSTTEFGMVTLADFYSTGSSVMPQKKNPDALEVIKAKAGFTHGQLMSLLGGGKGNFIGYNRDSQWTKYIMMDVIHECLSAPVVLAGVMETMTIHGSIMESWCHKGFIGATILMEQMATTFHLPMRRAKIIVEKAVKVSAGSECVTHEALMQVINAEGLVIPITKAQVLAWQDPKTMIGSMKSYGGPGNNSMKSSLKKLHKMLAADCTWLLQKQKAKESAGKLLHTVMASIVKGGETTCTNKLPIRK